MNRSIIRKLATLAASAAGLTVGSSSEFRARRELPQAEIAAQPGLRAGRQHPDADAAA